MGKRLGHQRRGKGSPTYRSTKGKGKAEHKRENEKGVVKDIIHDPGRTAPVAVVKYDDGEERNILAPEGLSVEDEITVGISQEIKPGNVLPLREIPEGVPIYSIELRPGDGGKLVKSSGTFAFVVTHLKDKTRIKLPSKQFKNMNPDCRASIGKVAGGGRTDKPLYKAGRKHWKSKGRGKSYPTVSGISMNAVDHPFGGETKPGKPKTVSRHAPSGQKSGSISPKRTGKEK